MYESSSTEQTSKQTNPALTTLLHAALDAQ